MTKIAAIAALLLSACSVEAVGPDAVSGVDAPSKADASADAAECPVEACPPDWLTCEPGRLRLVECQASCVGGAVCAGHNIVACVDDCRAYRFDAYCPG